MATDEEINAAHSWTENRREEMTKAWNRYADCRNQDMRQVLKARHEEALAEFHRAAEAEMHLRKGRS